MVTRTSVNPWPWSGKLGFDQAQLIESPRRTLFCSGQDAVDADGNPQHAGDIAAQLAVSLDNLEVVLGGAEMTLANVVRLNAYTTDVEALFGCWSQLQERFAAAGDTFVTSVLGVSRLAAPPLMVLLEATAVD